jgi:predicted nucleotidyltransferase
VEIPAWSLGVIDLPEDFRDLLIELHDAGAEFVVLGGHAVAYHGHPRATKDLDVLVRSSPANAGRVYKALASFGAPLGLFEVGEADFATYDGVLQIGLPPRRIDILNRVDGISFDEALAEHESFDVEGRRIPIIGLRALLKNKRAAARDQDLADVKALEAIAGRGSP